MRRRVPTADELDLWARATRDVRRRDGATPVPTVVPSPGPEPPTAPSAAPSRPPSLPAASAPGLDRRTVQRLRRGRFPIEASFDLHGHTQASAHDALYRFLVEARARGCRHVLVVTGRGAAGGGVLRRSVPRWLEEPGFARHVVGFQEAGPRHGGAGALYLVLRRGAPGG